MQTGARRAETGEPASDLWTATLDVVEAGQDVLADRIALLRMELRDDLSQMVLAIMLTLPATLLGCLAVVVASAALTVFLTRFVPTDAALALTALAILVGAGLLAFTATLRLRRRTLVAQPDPAVSDG